MLRLLFLLLVFSILLHAGNVNGQPKYEHGLHLDSLAARWDEGMPLGNGWLGALVWRKNQKLRVSLDRVDLWDDRPMPEIDQLKFNWVIGQVAKGAYDTVQKLGDLPYEKYAAPTKIPGAALEFDLEVLGKVRKNDLDLSNGLNEIQFENGMVLKQYIHATHLTGYFSIEGTAAGPSLEQNRNVFLPRLMVPSYSSGREGTSGNSVEGQGLERLGYPQGTLEQTPNALRYHQPTGSGTYYEVLVQWTFFPGNRLIGQWTISNGKRAELPIVDTLASEPTAWNEHVQWWNDYWSRSSVQLPDALLERQYYLELYKFGCVARSDTPPISLQAIWTADNGNLPPWKGDFHHDLNTQLSYWPGYASNHTDLTAGYTNWLWKVRDVNKAWTKNYFEKEGLNVPGVTTISGKEMGGWIQYSGSPTTAAWLAQHFYWQWKYTGDKKFLREKAYIYYNDVELFFSQMLQRRSDGYLHLPLSSSPEYHDNTIKAWFPDYTNYDLSLLKYFYTTGAEVAATTYSRRPNEWLGMLQDLPPYATDSTGLLIAAGQPLDETHRHHAHLMAVYPLGLLNNTLQERSPLLQTSLRQLEKIGTRWWCGYSFSWAACIYARARESEKAVEQLRIFATNFCSTNSFHLNGDQRGGQYSNFTYRPFTLEGNFAFAQGVHELLLQTHNEVIEVFPAVPPQWTNCSFNQLRAEGAVLVSARRSEGQTVSVTLTGTVDGMVLLQLPFEHYEVKGIAKAKLKVEHGVASISLRKGQTVQFIRK